MSLDRVWPSRRQTASLLAVLVVVGTLLRVAAVMYFADFTNPTAWEYGDTARSLVTGHGFSGGNWFAPADGTTPTAWSAPGYVFFLAGAMMLFHEHAFLAVELAQAVLSGLFPLLMYRLGDLLFGSRVALWSAVVATLYPALIYYPKQITPAVLTMSVTAVAVLAAVELGRRPSQHKAIGCGIVFGLATLTEPMALLTGLGVVALVRRRLSPRQGALLVGFVVLVLLPWEIRNYLTFQALVPVRTSSGANLWMGNNPFANGSAFTSDGKVMTAVLDRPTIDTLTAMDEVQRDATLRNLAIGWMLGHPIDVARLTVLRTIYLWWDPPGPSLYPDLLTGPSFAYRLQFALHLPVLVLSVLGLVLAWRHSRPGARLLIWWIVSTTLPYAITQASYRRYRLPAESALILAVAISLVGVLGWLTARGRLALVRTSQPSTGGRPGFESTETA